MDEDDPVEAIGGDAPPTTEAFQTELEAIGGDTPPTPKAFQRALIEEKLFSEMSEGKLSSDATGDEQPADSDGSQYYDLYKRGVWVAHLQELKQIRNLKAQYAKYILQFLGIFSVACLFLLLLDGINPKFDIWLTKGTGKTFIRLRMGGFHLNDTIMVTLIGSTAASAIGLVAIILQGLFKASKDGKGAEPPDKK